MRCLVKYFYLVTTCKNSNQKWMAKQTQSVCCSLNVNKSFLQPINQSVLPILCSTSAVAYLVKTINIEIINKLSTRSGRGKRIWNNKKIENISRTKRDGESRKTVKPLWTVVNVKQVEQWWSGITDWTRIGRAWQVGSWKANGSEISFRPWIICEIEYDWHDQEYQVI